MGLADGVDPSMHFPSNQSTNSGMGGGVYGEGLPIAPATSLQMLPNRPAPQYGGTENGMHQQELSYMKKRRRDGGGMGVVDAGLGVVRSMVGNGRGGRGRAKKCKHCDQFKKGSHGKNGKECPICPVCHQNRNEERWAAAHQPGQPCGVRQDASGQIVVGEGVAGAEDESGQIVVGEGVAEGDGVEKEGMCEESERLGEVKGSELTIAIEMEG